MSGNSGDSEDRPFHYEGGKPVFDGPAERDQRREEARRQQDDEFRKSQIEIAREQTSLQRQTLATQIALIVFGIIGTGISLYQAHVSRISTLAATNAASAAQSALEETKRSDSVQENLSLLAMQQTAKLAKDSLTASAEGSAASLAAARDNLRADQRPFLSIEVKPPGYQLAAGQPLLVDVSITNHGRTPAIKVFGNRTLFTGKDALIQADTWFTALDKASSKPSGAMTVFPTQPGAVVGQFMTVGDPRIPLTQEQYNWIISNDSVIAAVGRYTYSDLSGKRYHTDFCISRLTTGAISSCARHNEVY